MPLTAPQIEAITLLIAGQVTNQAIASTVGVSNRTLSRWLADRLFVDAWERESQALSRACINKLRDQGVSPAVQTLIDLSTDESIGAADRIRACVEILKFSGLKPVERSQVDLSGVIEQRMSIERAHAIVAQVQRVNLKLLTELPDIEVKSGS